MDYKEKYEQALEKCRKLYNEAKANDYTSDIEDYETIFPELKENEDERIRKEIISYLKRRLKMASSIPAAIGYWIAWLEKQGEQKPIDKIQLGKKYKCIASPRYSTFRRGNIYKPVDNFLCNLMNLCYECFEPIEDSEQKPAWSEEDKDMLENILGTYKTLEDMLDLSTEQDQDILTSMNFERDWLKSLKQRIGG